MLKNSTVLITRFSSCTLISNNTGPGNYLSSLDDRFRLSDLIEDFKKSNAFHTFSGNPNPLTEKFITNFHTLSD